MKRALLFGVCDFNSWRRGERRWPCRLYVDIPTGFPSNLIHACETLIHRLKLKQFTGNNNKCGYSASNIFFQNFRVNVTSNGIPSLPVVTAGTYINKLVLQYFEGEITLLLYAIKDNFQILPIIEKNYWTTLKFIVEYGWGLLTSVRPIWGNQAYGRRFVF